jgi:hypothetical protein
VWSKEVGGPLHGAGCGILLCFIASPPSSAQCSGVNYVHNLWS